MGGSRGNAIGCIISILGSVVGNIGINVQKQAHINNHKLPERLQKKSETQLPLWWLGLSLVVIGSVCDFISFGYATQSLAVAAGGATTLVSNCVVAKFWHREAVDSGAMVGVGFIIIGAVFFALFSPETPDYNLSHLTAFAWNSYFIAYVVVLVAWAVAMLYLISDTAVLSLRSLVDKRFNQLSVREQELYERVQLLEDQLMAVMTKLELGAESIRDSFVERSKTSSVVKHEDDDLPARQQIAIWVNPYVYALCSGLIGSLSVLFASCASIVLINAIAGRNEFNKPAPYFFICMMLCTVVTQTHLLSRALELGEVLSVFPLFQAVWICGGIIGGIVFYQLREDMSPIQWGMYCLGGACMLFGCGLLIVHGKKLFGASTKGKFKRGVHAVLAANALRRLHSSRVAEESMIAELHSSRVAEEGTEPVVGYGDLRSKLGSPTKQGFDVKGLEALSPSPIRRSRRPAFTVLIATYIGFGGRT
jgi:hypothetical protein